MTQSIKQDAYIFTSESVSEGHPDKICDIVSDALVDAYLVKDPYAKLAIETIVTTNRLMVVGEVSSTQPVLNDEREYIIRQCLKDIG